MSYNPKPLAQKRPIGEVRVSGVLAERCAEILSEFFAARRREGKK